MSRVSRIVCLLSLCAVPALAQENFLVSLTNGGRVTVNEAELYKFGSGDDMTDQAVVGPDLYHLRGDGVVWKNGAREFENPFAVGSGTTQWIKIAADDAMNIFCLETTGRQTQMGVVIADLPNPNGERTYVDMDFADGALWTLRDDGKVYRGGVEFYDFQGIPTNLRTSFLSLSIDPARSQIYAMRRDGMIWRGQITTIPSTPELVGDFPSNTPEEDWTDLNFDSGGTELWAIRRDGVVFHMPLPSGSGIAYVVYPGDGLDGGREFRSLEILDGEPVAVRYDGAIFIGANTAEICDLKGNGYITCDLTSERPITDNAKIAKPIVATYKTNCYVNDPIEIPILVSSTSTNNFQFTAIAVPTWGTFDDQQNPPVFSGTPTMAGSDTLEVQVDDGLNPVKTYKYKFVVKEGDTDPEKNKKPQFQKLKKVQAITGVEITIPLRAYDADGDTLSYAVGEMPEGMVFDDGSISGAPSLTWTPPICAGDWKIEITAVDQKGAKPAKGKVQISTATAIHP